MKYVIGFYIAFVLTISACMVKADTAPTPSPTPAVVAAPVDAPLAEVTGPKPVPAIVKDESMAPPVWMQDIVVQAKALPVVGPYVVKIGQGLLILLSILTALTACLTSILAILKTVTNKAGLSEFADKVQAFQNSKVIYYLKFASLAFNAQKVPAIESGAEAEAEARA